MGRGETRKSGEIKARSEDADNEEGRRGRGVEGVCKEFQMERRHPKEVEGQIKRET